MSFAEEWEGWSRAVLPANAPEVQIVECRRAFYAGAFALMSKMVEISERPGNPSQNAQDAAELDRLHEEILGFGLRGGLPACRKGPCNLADGHPGPCKGPGGAGDGAASVRIRG